ncbi:MAG: hypothetical protein ACK5MT_00555 [Actinomycetales bacterium]
MPTLAATACTSGVRFEARKKLSTSANVAIARELAGWSWSLVVMDE